MAVREGRKRFTPEAGFDAAYPPARGQESMRRETRRGRATRQAKRGRLYASAAIALAALVCLVALIVANTGQVRLDWIFGSGTASLVWIVLGATILGWLLGLATSSLFRWRTRAPRFGGRR